MIDSRQRVVVVRLGATAEKRLSRNLRPYKTGRGQKRHKMEEPVSSVVPVAGKLTALSHVVGTIAHCRELFHRLLHLSRLVIGQSS